MASSSPRLEAKCSPRLESKSPSSPKLDKQHSAETLIAEREGILTLTKGSTKAQEFLKLYGGSLYGFGKPGSQKVKWVLHLQDTRVEEKGGDLVLHHSNKVYTLSSTDAETFPEWVKAIKAATKLVPFHLPREQQKGFAFRTKKSLATSNIGTTLIKNAIDKTGKKILRSVRKIMAYITGSKTLAKKVEWDAIKLVVKSYFLWDLGKLHPGEIGNVETASRQALKSLLIILLNHSKLRNNVRYDEIVGGRVKETLTHIEKLGVEIKRLLQPHLSPKDMARIDQIYSCLNNAEMVKKALIAPEIASHVEFITQTTRDYLGWDGSACDNVTLLFGTPKGGFGF